MALRYSIELIALIARRRGTNRICASAAAAPSRLERYIADIPPERYGQFVPSAASSAEFPVPRNVRMVMQGGRSTP